MLTVYKASAGSGKTFRLVLEYLKLMLTRKNYYRQILAVTFTNKATAEMKERIVEQLGAMASGEKSPYLDILVKDTGQSEEKLRIKAAEALKNLLFDYNRFSVSTIDKFTQQVLKSFNREIGINPYYQIETDSDMLVSEAADRMIANIAANKPLKEWLESYINEKIRNNRSFEFERELKSLGNELFKEKLQSRFTELADFTSDQNRAADYLKKLDQIIYSFENTWKKRITALVDRYRQSGYSRDDFSGKGRGIGGWLEKAADDYGVVSVTALKAGEGPEGWLTRASMNNTGLLQLVNDHLLPELRSLLTWRDNGWRHYCTAQVIKREWYTASILVDLNREVLALSREKGVLPLASSNQLLQAIIDGNDAPFIFERVGNQYSSFMLDEFQDTSLMQWNNFRPLVINSMATGEPNLIVGDIKQSIYRWRNSSWQLLEEQIYRDFNREQMKDVSLKTNHRSSKEVVFFNNSLIEVLLMSMAGSKKLESETEQFRERLQNIYRDLKQESSERTAAKGGYICIEKLGSEEADFEQLSLDRLTAQVRTLYDQGFRASDIVVLVRGKREGVRIVEHFMKVAGEPQNQNYNFQVVSGESLFLSSSPAVLFIVELFKYLHDRKNHLIRATLHHLYQNYLKPRLNPEPNHRFDPSPFENPLLFEAELEPQVTAVEEQMAAGSLSETIIRISAAFRLMDIPSEMPYIQTLIDQAAELGKTNAGDIPGFLEWWEETGCEESVHVNEEMDAIRLMTIHKSKGLEFRAVLMPFFNWKLSVNGRNVLWCEPKEPPFNEAPIVPVNITRMLGETIFREEWLQENFNVIVDNLNLIYVAITRAESVLWVNVPVKSESTDVGSYLLSALDALSEKAEFAQCFDETRFSYGTLPLLRHINREVEDVIPSHWQFSEFTERLRLKVTGEELHSNEDQGVTNKAKGIIIHDLLATIKTVHDIETAVSRGLAAGSIPRSEEGYIRGHIQRMVSHPIASEWFSGKWQVLNEADILAPTATWRPDRVMISGGSAVVVDFKTGGKKREAYVRQVENYIRLLREAGYSPVTGYLWHMHSDEPELVIAP